MFSYQMQIFKYFFSSSICCFEIVYKCRIPSSLKTSEMSAGRESSECKVSWYHAFVYCLYSPVHFKVTMKHSLFRIVSFDKAFSVCSIYSLPLYRTGVTKIVQCGTPPLRLRVQAFCGQSYTYAVVQT